MDIVISNVNQNPPTRSELRLLDFNLISGSDFVPNTSFPAIDTLFELVKNGLESFKKYRIMALEWVPPPKRGGNRKYVATQRVNIEFKVNREVAN